MRAAARFQHADFYETMRLTGDHQEEPDVICLLEVADTPWGGFATTPHQKWNVFHDGSPW